MKVDSESIMNKIQRLRLYDAAAIKFIEKVDKQEAKSTVTYRELKEALTLNTDGSNEQEQN